MERAREKVEALAPTRLSLTLSLSHSLTHSLSNSLTLTHSHSLFLYLPPCLSVCQRAHTHKI